MIRGKKPRPAIPGQGRKILRLFDAGNAQLQLLNTDNTSGT